MKEKRRKKLTTMRGWFQFFHPNEVWYNRSLRKKKKQEKTERLDIRAP
jgi:hypothetical protein